MLNAAAEKQAEEQARVVEGWGRDPILCARQVFPHWFKRPMPWFHRGIIAIMLRRTDFLLNFSEPGKPEQWAGGSRHWTKKDLAKLVRNFRYKVRPNDPKSPTAPIFRVRYDDSGRNPVAIDMVIGTHVVLIIPRGFSKTTIVNFVNLYKTLFKLTRFTVYISESATHAKDQIATIKRELAANERIRAFFGELKPSRTDEETWGAESFETKTGVKMAARGRGSQIRGMNKFGDRPDTVCLDDVEDKESVSTPEQREKALSWYTSDVEQALQRDFGEYESCIYAIGTLLHPKALLPTLEKDPSYTTIKFGALIPTGEFTEQLVEGKVKRTPIMEALWDDKAGMSVEAVALKKQSFVAKGKLYEFGLEFMSDIRDQDKLKFRPEYIRYEQHRPEDFVARAIHIDPAIGKDASDCYTAIAVVGITEKGRKHICDMHLEIGMPMSAQAEKYFEMKMAWNCTHHSSESVAYQAALAQVIRELMFQKAKKFGPKAYFEIVDTWPAGRKVERIEGILQPIMASGYLTFQQIWPELEVQLLDWPNERMDGPDAVAGAIATLEPYAMLVVDDMDAFNAANSEPSEPYEAPCAAGRDYVP